MSKETFKTFAKQHPELAKTVLNGTTTWQKLYEIYDIYGEKSNIWDNYIKEKATKEPIKELFQTFKNLDMEQVQKGINNLQKTIGLFQDMGFSNKNQSSDIQNNRPLYTYFDD